MEFQFDDLKNDLLSATSSLSVQSNDERWRAAEEKGEEEEDEEKYEKLDDIACTVSELTIYKNKPFAPVLPFRFFFFAIFDNAKRMYLISLMAIYQCRAIRIHKVVLVELWRRNEDKTQTKQMQIQIKTIH